MTGPTTTPSREEWIALRSKVWDAQKLARTILGRDATELTGTDMLQAIRTFASMKEELQQLQRESHLTKQALVATQCSRSYISKRLERIADTNAMALDSMAVDQEETALPEQTHQFEGAAEETDPDSSFDDDVPHPEANLEEEIMRIVPTKTKSLGVGLLGDMEHCIVEWQTTFEQLNDQHEFQVQACQADLERLHVRLDTMKALNPTGVEAAAAAQKARDQLEKLVKIVEAFPTKARMEALRSEIEASKWAERESHEELARATHELEAVRKREQDLLRRLEEAESSRAQLEADLASVSQPKNRSVPGRLLKFTKKRLQRLFRLDRSARRQTDQSEGAYAPDLASQNLGNSTFPSTSDGEHMDFSSDSGLSVSSGHPDNPNIDTSAVDLHNLGSNDEELLVFSASDHDDSSDEEVERNQEDWSLADTLDATYRQDVLLAHTGNFSPSKLTPSSSSDEGDLNLSKVTATDETILSEGHSFGTDATTDSSSGTPPKKNAGKKARGSQEIGHQREGTKSFFAMAKSMLFIQ